MANIDWQGVFPALTTKFTASGAIDCNSIITDVRPLEKITDAFQALSGNAQAMKSLIKCS